jgi:signal transduction histidine kinase/ActR/RegA family two-component response regulator
MTFRPESAFAVTPNAAAAIVTLVLASGTFARRRLAGSPPLLLLEISVFLWNLGESMILMAGDPQTLVAGQIICDFGAYTVAPSGLLLMWGLARNNRPVPSWLQAILFGLPLAAVTTYFTGLPWLYRQIDIIRHESVSGSGVEYGPLIMPLLLFTNVLLSVTAIRTAGLIMRGGTVQRVRASVLLIAVLIPWVLFGVEVQLGRIVASVGLAAFSVAVAVSVLHAVDRRFQSLDIAPLARAIVVDSMPDAMIVCTVTGHVADFNPASEQLLGLHPNALGNRIESVLRELGFDSRGFFPCELIDHQGRVLLVSRTPVEKWGGFAGTIYVFRDHTLQKRQERELREATRVAQNAARMQSEFLANMSHEIRTPLNGIIGMNQLLLESGELSPLQQEYAEIVRDSAESMRVIVNDILDFSKIEAGLMPIDMLPMDLPRIIRETVALFRELGRAKGLELRILIEDGFPDAIYGDPVRIRQILSNLLSNALKFTDRGCITTTLRRSSEGWYEVSVQDTGAGFDPAIAEALFERFVQADPSTTRRRGGAGLGLSISRKLAVLMGGQIRAQSGIEGGGSIFRFELPLREAAAVPKQVASVAAVAVNPAGFRGRVLLAEDNPTNQKLAKTLLERMGCAVEAVSDGEAAFEQARTGRWDLIFLDCFMPRMDGYTAAEKIRSWEKENGKPRIPIVAITASVLDSDRKLCFASGMDDVLAKPIEPSELRRTLSERLEKTEA